MHKTMFEFVTQKAVKDQMKLNEKDGNEANYTTLSGDDTWMKRGFTYIGDGDSETCTNIVDVKPYGACIGDYCM
ncbi:hypothetical protein HHI36_020016 [Cryptolaemus montrouzieri]|uniref:Uncharacterized protein n=1 Tax=Cryptolaemus montrouzieri TaxID=559131 RepID=A0ABD2N9R8_9CUCU